MLNETLYHNNPADLGGTSETTGLVYFTPFLLAYILQIMKLRIKEVALMSSTFKEITLRCSLKILVETIVQWRSCKPPGLVLLRKIIIFSHNFKIQVAHLVVTSENLE